MVGSSAQPIDDKRALRADAELLSMVTDYDRLLCRPALLRAHPLRLPWRHLFAVCRCVAALDLRNTSRLTQHSPVVRVRVPRGAGPKYYVRSPLTGGQGHL